MSRTALAILIAGIVLALATGGYALYWFLRQDSTQRNYQVNTQSQQYQAGLVAAERDRVQGYTVATDEGQLANLKATFCAVYPDLEEPIPNDLRAAAQTIGCP